MLSVDGYTVKWGADTTDFDRASDKVRKRVQVDSAFFSDEWEKAQIKFRNRVFGISNIGIAAIGGVAASIGIAAKALDKFAKVDPNLGAELASISKEINAVWYEIGANVSGVVDIIKGGVGYMRAFIELSTDFFQGKGPSIGEVVEQRAAQQAAIDQRTKFVTDAETALRSSARPEDLVDLWEQANAATDRMEREADDRDAQFTDPKSMARSRWLYNAQFEEIWKPFYAAQEKIDKANKAKEEAIAKSNEGFSKKFASQLEYIDQTEKAREFISTNVRLAEIEDMRARGLERQADAAKIRLDTEKEIRQILEQEGVGIDEQLSAIDAIRGIADRRIAALKDPKKRQPEDISTFLAPGMIGASRELAPQVMGRAGATYDKTISLQEQQLNVLQDIARNTSQTPVGVLGP